MHNYVKRGFLGKIFFLWGGGGGGGGLAIVTSVTSVNLFYLNAYI